MKKFKAEETIDFIRFLNEEHAEGRDRLLAISRHIKSDGTTIADIGGAGGYFLSQIEQISNYDLKLYNIEMISYYANRQKSQKIEFINESILDNSVPSYFFDVVTFRNLLHHLVGDSLSMTRKNQLKAVSEAIRITKRGGVIIFDEEVNNIRMFSSMVYYLSKVFHILGLKAKSFQAGTSVVYFMNQKEVSNAIEMGDEESKISDMEMTYTPWDMSLRWKLTLLMSSVGNVSVYIKMRETAAD